MFEIITENTNKYLGKIYSEFNKWWLGDLSVLKYYLLHGIPSDKDVSLLLRKEWFLFRYCALKLQNEISVDGFSDKVTEKTLWPSFMSIVQLFQC